MSLAERSDEDLVADWVGGDRAAFDELVRRYRRRVYGICFRYFRDASDAEDAAQDAFVALLRRAHTFQGTSSFSTWMYRVAVNACNDLARKRSRRPQRSDTDVSALGDELASADDLVAQRELGMVLEQALSALDPDTRVAIVLHDVQGVPYQDIAERLGVAVGTVKSRIHRGHARLAALLAETPARDDPAPDGTLSAGPASNTQP